MQNWLRSGATAAGIALMTGLGLTSNAAIANDFVTLRDGNAIYRTNIFTFSANQATWWVDGVNHQFTDQYFFNFGTSPTQAALEFQDLSLISLLQPTTNRFLAEFSALGGSLNVFLDSSLLGFAEDSRRSRRDESITLVNNGATAIDFTLFNYIDFDLLDFDDPLEDSFNNDTTFFQNNRLIQTDPSGTQATVGTHQVPTVVQIAEYPFLISQLKSDLRPNLVNVPGPLTNGDGSAALQFNRSLQPGSSLTFRFIKQIQYEPDSKSVPEPTALFSLAVVAGGLLLRRRGG